MVSYVGGAGGGVLGTSFNLTIPAGVVAGDVLLLVVEQRAGRQLNTPSGFGLVYKRSVTYADCFLFQKTAVAGDAGASLTVSSTDAGSRMAGVLAAYTGGTVSGAVSGGDSTSLSITTTAPNSMLVCLWGAYAAGGDIATTTADAPLTHRKGAGVAYSSAAVGDQVIASAGATGTRTASSSNSSLSWASFSVAIAPAVDPSVSVAGVLPQLTAAVAVRSEPSVSGAVAGVLPAVSGSVAVTSSTPAVVSVAGVLPALAGSVSVSSVVPVRSSSEYANYGYNYTGLGLVEFDPPIAPTPARVRREVTRRVHQSLPAPNLVDGRPV